MAFRTRRQYRYNLLRQNGFLPFESQELSKVPFKQAPYMGILIKERKEFFDQAIKEFMPKVQYVRTIRKEYDSNGWTIIKHGRIQSTSAWRMLHDAEDAYRTKHPGYKSPWEKRRKLFVSFMKETEEKQSAKIKQMIKDIQMSINRSKNKTRKQKLQNQITNLETWLEK